MVEIWRRDEDFVVRIFFRTFAHPKQTVFRTREKLLNQ